MVGQIGYAIESWRATAQGGDGLTKTKVGVLVHGGAGTWGEERLAPAIEGCKVAASKGASVLDRGALAAAVEAVKVLEENPLYNAGRGASLTREGSIELDAAVMTGDLRFGGVAACPPVSSAILAALKVYEGGEHALLMGDGAAFYVSARGVEMVPPEELITPRAREAFEKVRDRVASGMGWREATQKPIEPESPGTVGAVAVDANGVLAAATSTGGITYQRLGRVGDTPLPGAGTYADQLLGGAASSTGGGEAIMRFLLARDAVERLGRGADVAEAAKSALELLAERIQGKAGLILIDKEGNAFAATVTKAMPWALARSDSEVDSGS